MSRFQELAAGVRLAVVPCRAYEQDIRKPLHEVANRGPDSSLFKKWLPDEAHIIHDNRRSFDFDQPPDSLDEGVNAVNLLPRCRSIDVNTNEGDTFTFPEISSWLKEAGFVNPRTLDAPGPSPLVLATKS